MDMLTPVLTDPESRRAQIRLKALDAIRGAFPLQLRDKTIEIQDLKVHEKDFGPHDQKHALLSGGSLFEPVKGTVILRGADGKEIERVKDYALLNLPFFTGRHTFVLDGNEYNVANQLRLKPGVYTRRRGNEELEAQFNLSKGSNFRLSLDPAQGHPYIEYGTTSIPLYPILRKFGITHSDVSKEWGHDVAAQNQNAFEGKHDKHLEKLYGKLLHPSKQTATTPEGHLAAINTAYAATAMDPEVTKETLGHAFSSVTPQALLTASKKLLNVYKSNEDTDDRDALRFKTYHSVDDFIKERIALDARTLAMKVKGRATHKTALRAILPSSPFSAGVRNFLTGSQLSAIPTHINPVEAIDHAVRVTSLGEGGIPNERAIPREARMIHSSHLGMLDPIRTSESFRAGIDIRTALTAHRDARGNLYVPVLNLKTRKPDFLSAGQMAAATIAFPKQKMTGLVSAMHLGHVANVPAAQVTHELYDASQLYSPTTNLTPFLESMQGNRGIMSGKFQTQALPLVHREVPLVQSAANSTNADGSPNLSSWERELAAHALPMSPVSGRVVKVDSQYIYIDPSGKKHAEDYEWGVKTAFEKRAGSVKRQKTVKNIVFKIELEPGDKRSGISPEGKKWEKTMSVAYGHIPKTLGDDGETVDIYLKEDGAFENVYVVHQRKKDGAHDEDKCMVGFESKEAAKDAYEKHGPEWGYGSLSEYTWDEFKDDYLTEHAKTAATADLIRVPYETHLPFASKTYLHHDLLVKPGDHVVADQHLAESNFTRNGVFALGRNMTIGYVPYYGMNSNDAVVISEGAADKLTSEHMYKELLEVDRDSMLGRDVHKQYFGLKYSADNYRHLDSNGVVKRGTKVMPHDLLITGVTKTKLKGSDRLLANFKKSLVSPYRELVRTWDHDFEGEVIDVFATDTRVVVTIKTREPMRVGDKLCYSEDTEVLTSEGWLPVSEVTVNDRVCTLQDGYAVYTNPSATHAFPTADGMYQIKSQQVDLLVTDTHQMYVKPRGADKFALYPAKTILGKRVQYKKDAAWRGVTPKFITFPALEVRAGQGGRGTRNLPAIKMPAKTYLFLLGAFLSEGNTMDQESTGSYGIEITQIKQPGRKHLEAALKKANLPFTDTGDKVRIHSKQLLQHFIQFGKSYQKFIPNEVFSWSRKDLKILFQWLMWGDGHTSAKGMPIVYKSTSKRLADDVQRLALHIGKAANVTLAKAAGPQTIKGKVYQCRDFWQTRIVNTKLEPMVSHGHTKTQQVQVEQLTTGYGKPVYCVTVPGHVLYVRRNGIPVWCGNTGRHGNKGVVSMIVPDHKMLQDESGKPLEVLYTSAGVISRINPSQILETVAAKVAKKMGTPLLVENFSGRDNVQWVKDLAKQHNVKDKETLLDPVSGKKIPGILVGPQYVLRLFKTTETNFAARGTGAYDVNQQPIKGGDEGAKAIGKMEFNALVAHNARNVLRESSVLKSQKNDEFWRAIQLGLPLPPLKSAFAYNKFIGMLHGAGVKVDTRGSIATLSPLTDKDVTRMSSGAVQNEKLVRAKDLEPERGGLFDPAVTGGTDGVRWSHIDLAEPVVNPVFADPARRILGMSSKDFERHYFDHGANAIKDKLNAVVVDKRIAELRDATKKLSGVKLDDTVKQLKFLDALHKQGLRPGDAYVLTKLPVLPPVMRPIMAGKSGAELVVGDSNYLYQSAMLHNQALQRQVASPILPPDEHAKLRKNLFTAVGAVIGTHESDNPKLQKRQVKGFLEHLTGKTTPKCYDDQTDILTENGWVPCAQYKGNVRVATVNLQTQAFEWQTPTAVIAAPYEGMMVHTQSRELDVCVTPNHEHVVSYRRNKVVDGKKTYTWTGWRKARADSFVGTDRRRVMVSAERWDALTPVITFNGGTGAPTKGRPTTNLEGTFTPDPVAFAEFVGWWVAEGWISTGGSQVSLCQAATSPHVSTVDDCFTRMGIPFTRKVYTRKDGYQSIWWTLRLRSLANWLTDNCGKGCENKKLSAAILQWPSAMLEPLLRGYLQGDGSIHRSIAAEKGNLKTRKRRKALGAHAGTASLRLVDDLQHLATKIGYQVLLRGVVAPLKSGNFPQYLFSVRGFSDVTIESGSFTQMVPYSGMVYCVTVPNGTVVVRRNGKPAVSGNSSFFQKKIMKRQQDVSGRGTIAPDGSLGMDEIGLPEDMLWGMYGKFVIARLVRRGFNAVASKEMVEKKHPAARDALMAEIKERPVMVNRAPTLHRYAFVGANPVPVAGKTIRVNPFIELGMNADYDGNCILGSSKLVLTVSGGALSLLNNPSPQETTLKFGPTTRVLSQNKESAILDTEIQAIPHEATPYTVDKNGARSYHVPEGLRVWSYDPKSGAPVFAEVTALTIEDACEVAVVSTRRGYDVTASTNESLCVYDHETEGIRKIAPCDAVGKLAPILLQIPLAETIFGDFEFGWLVGSYISDGFLMGDREHYFGYSKVSDAHRDRFAAAVNAFEGSLIKRTTYRDVHTLEEGACIQGESVKDHFYGAKKVSELFQSCYGTPRVDGRASLSKCLPDFSTWSLEARFGVLVGLLDGDGCLTYSTGKAKAQVLANVATSAPALAQQIPLLLRTLGIRSSVTETAPKEGRVQTHTAYTITLSTVDLQKHLGWLRRGLHQTARAQQALTMLEGDGQLDQRDLVPVPHRLMELAASTRGPCALDSKLRASLASSKSARKAGPYVSRAVAFRMLQLFKAAEVPDITAWETIVSKTEVTWDVIEDFKVLSMETVYDLIVPTTQIFAVNDGLVVWDTFQIHVPVLKPAVDEVKTMTLSNLLFSDREKDSLMVAPRMEAMLGMHLATRGDASPNGKVHHFKTKADAMAAYHRGEIALNSKVEVG